MNLFEAKQILNQSGYKLLKEKYERYRGAIVIEKNLEENLEEIERGLTSGQYVLGLTEEEKNQINELDPDFIYQFSCLGAEAGFDYCYVTMIYDEYGEGPSAYDPGWGESKFIKLVEKMKDINEKIKQMVNELIKEYGDSAENLNKILEILLNRDSEKDEIIE